MRWIRTGALVLAVASAAGCSSSTFRPGAAAPAVSTTIPGPLVAPSTTAAQDAKYFSVLAAADPTLGTYIQQDGDVALPALLTDGSAFCAFLKKGGGIDNAMTSVVIGADGVEPQTHLPTGVTTYNAIDSVALLELCPAEMTLVPAAVAGRVQAMGRALGG